MRNRIVFRRLFSLLLCCVMACSLLPLNTFAATEYDIWVGGVQVTDTNKEDVLGDGKVHYVPASGTEDATLYLTNATIRGVEGNDKTKSGIYTDESLHVVVNGTCYVQTTTDEEIKSQIHNHNSYDYSDEISGICADELTISGSGTLNITSTLNGLYMSKLDISQTNVCVTGCGYQQAPVLAFKDSGASICAYVHSGLLELHGYAIYDTDLSRFRFAGTDHWSDVKIAVPKNYNVAVSSDMEERFETNVTGMYIWEETDESRVLDPNKFEYEDIDGNGYVIRHLYIGPQYTGTEEEWYSVFAGGVRVTENNKNDVLGDGTVRYEPETDSLYLDNASLLGRQGNERTASGIYSAIPNLNVVVTGVCSVESYSLTYTNYGIGIPDSRYYVRNIRITGSGILNVNSPQGGGIYCNNLYVQGVEELNILTKGHLKSGLKASKFELTSSKVSITSPGRIDKWPAGSEPINVDDIIMHSGSLELHLTENRYFGECDSITAPADYIMTGGEKAGEHYPLGEAEIGGVTTKTYTLDIEDELAYEDTFGETVSAKHIYFTDRSAIPVAICYPVCVGGVPVTSWIKDDVLGDGTVSYTPASGGSCAVLSLNNAEIHGKGSDIYKQTTGIYSEEDLIIDVSGSCSVFSNTSAIYEESGCELTIQGRESSSLQIDGNNCGIRNNYGLVTLDVPLLTISAGNPAVDGPAIYADDYTNVLIKRGDITLENIKAAAVSLGAQGGFSATYEAAIVGGKTDKDEYPLTFDGSTGQYTYGDGKAASYVHIVKRVHMDAPQNLLLVSEQASWSAVENASYEFTLYKVGSTGGEPVMTLTTDETEIDLRKVYPDLACGEYYYYTVKAFRSFYEYSAVMKSKAAYIPYPTLTGEATYEFGGSDVGNTVTVRTPTYYDSKTETIMEYKSWILHYQWQRSADGESWTDIADKKGKSYTVQKTDEGKYLRVIVTADGYRGQLTGSARYVTPSVTGTVVINGTPRYGSTLKAFVNGSQDTVFLYSWSIDGGSFGAASSSGEHTITVGDIGHTLRCMATAYGNVTGSLISEEVLIGKQPGPAAPSVVGHPATEADDSNGWIENDRDVRVEYSTDSEFKTGSTIASGNIYDLRSGTYYVRTPATDWRDASEAAKVTVGSHTDALAIKPIDPIPFGRSGYWTDDIYVEAVGGTAPYTWTILNQPLFSDPINDQSYTSETELHWTVGSSASAHFMVQFPQSAGSNYGRMRIRVTDSKGDFAEIPIFFEGYKGTQPDYHYFFTLKRNTARQDFSTKTYTYGYDPIPKSEHMIVTLQNTCSDNNYAIRLSDLTFDLSDNNGNEFFDCYIDPAFNGTELKRYEEVDIYIVPKTGLDVSNGWVYGYPVTLRVSHPEKMTPVSLSGSVYFKVEPKALSGCTVEPVSPQLCTGSPVTPELTIWDGKRYLTVDDCYVEWSNNVETGTAGYTVRAKVFSYYDIPEAGTGNYTGELGGTFQIREPYSTDVFLNTIVPLSDKTQQSFDISGYLPAGSPTVQKVSQSGDILASVSYESGRILFSVSDTAREGGTGTIQYRVTKDGQSFLVILSVTVYDDALKGTLTLSGSAFKGSTLYAQLADNNAEGTLIYQWMRGNTAIPGATEQSYLLTAEDVGSEISVIVSDTGHTGTLTAGAGIAAKNAFSSVSADGRWSLRVNAEPGDILIAAAYDASGRMTGATVYTFTEARKTGAAALPEGSRTRLSFMLLNSDYTPVCAKEECGN